MFRQRHPVFSHLQLLKRSLNSGLGLGNCLTKFLTPPTSPPPRGVKVKAHIRVS